MCRINILPVFKPDEFYIVEKFKENRRMAKPHYQQRGTVTEATAPEPEPEPESPPEPEGEPEPSSTSKDESGNESTIIDLT